MNFDWQDTTNEAGQVLKEQQLLVWIDAWQLTEVEIHNIII